MTTTYPLLFTSKKLAVYSFILLLSHCKDTYDNTIDAAKLQVPAYTETGANTFGCLVNGAPWANFGEEWVRPAEDIFGAGGHLVPNKVIAGIYYDQTNADSVFSVTAFLTISKKGVDVRNEHMSFNLVVPKGGKLKGVYQLTSRDYQFGLDNYKPGYWYSSLISNPFIVTIRKDSTTTSLGRIVSGTFNGTLYFPNSQSDTLRIVGGVFDVLVH